MVLDYYKLREHPFGVTPDASYLFMGASHGEALGSVLYGVEAGCGFVALIAKPGLGKTTLLYYAMDQLREKAKTVFLFQTVCSPLDLLRALLSGLGVHDVKGRRPSKSGLSVFPLSTSGMLLRSNGSFRVTQMSAHQVR